MMAKAGSNLERVLAEGRFALTAEVGPPRGPDPEAVINRRKGDITDYWPGRGSGSGPVPNGRSPSRRP